MSRLKLFHDWMSSIGGGVLLLFLMQPGHRAAGTSRVDSQAYLERGDRVEKNYLTYGKRLERHYDALIVAVKEYAPDLLPLLQSPEPVSYGYQILPRIVAISTAEMRARTGPVTYSWPWTDHLIDKELAEIADGETKLRHAAEVNSTERRAILKNLAENYRELSRWLGNIHAHVQYNRLWQAAIAADRSGYDRETVLFNDVVERQKIIDRLNRLRGGFETSRLSDVRLAVLELAGGLRERQALLTRRIDQEMGQTQTPNFIKMENSDNEWIFHVPLITDIEDHEYVLAVKAAIENAWRLRDGQVEYRIELEVTHISARALYSDEERPMQGQKIDIRHHLERFSSDAAILTTGGRTTHVQRHAIVLGPHPITPHVLAHEFGHILGFRDRYVRGYENLGEHGFRVMEVVADDSDVMAATGYGTVGRRHFVELRHRARAGSQLHENPKSQRITISTSVRRISIESAHRDPPYALQLPLLLMIMPARRGDDGDDHNREHTESNQQSDRGIHTQDLSAGRSGWSLRSRLARLPGGSSRPRSAFPSFTFGPCAILSVSTLNADIDAPIAHLSFYRPFPFILPWSVLGARDSSESKRDNEQKCA